MNDQTTAAGASMEGPAAPKDPAAKRSGFYIMYEAKIEGTSRPWGVHSQEIYLEGRLVDQARYTGAVSDEAILELLKSTAGFRRLVHSIGVSVRPDKAGTASLAFTMQHYAKTDRFQGGTRLTASIPGDGSETLLLLEGFQWSADDDVPGKLVFEFAEAGETASASVVFYLNDGYEVPEVEVEPAVDYSSAAYSAMIARSLMHTGNTRRLKAAIEKAKRGEEVTLAYIGGSITQGAGAVPVHTQSYVYKSYEQFRQRFGAGDGSHIRLIKAGLGGTPSELGLVRYERDVLRDGTVEPDVVVIEFAVNDAGDETKGVCYESLVLKALGGAKQPAVILLFSVFVNDWNLQERLAPVGWHYDLPMVSVKDAVVEQFRLSKQQENVISKKQFFYDIYHPANAGHQVMADCLGLLFEAADQAAPDQEDIHADKPPFLGDAFKDIRLLDRRNGEGLARISAGGFVETDSDLQMAPLDDQTSATPQFPYNWMHTAASGAESFRMELRCKRLILVFKDSGSSSFGKALVRVDGEDILTADPHVNNWTHCNAVILYHEAEAREHRIEITMASGDEDKQFTILGFGVVL